MLIKVILFTITHSYLSFSPTICLSFILCAILAFLSLFTPILLQLILPNMSSPFLSSTIITVLFHASFGHSTTFIPPTYYPMYSCHLLFLSLLCIISQYLFFIHYIHSLSHSLSVTLPYTFVFSIHSHFFFNLSSLTSAYLILRGSIISVPSQLYPGHLIYSFKI